MIRWLVIKVFLRPAEKKDNIFNRKIRNIKRYDSAVKSLRVCFLPDL